MTFWSGAKLAKDAAKIIEPFDKNQIDCNAITLTLGPEVFVTPDFGMDPRSNLKTYLKPVRKLEDGGENYKMLGGEIIIPAGHFAYLITEEIIHIPDKVMGFISLKSKVKWLGLINVSGFHVDPGYKGRLIYSVYNAGPSQIHLQRGQDVFLLWLADLDNGSSKGYVKEGKSILSDIPNDMISNVDRPIHSLPKLSEKIESLSNEVNNMKTIAIWAIGLASLVAAIISAVVSSQIFESEGGGTGLSKSSKLEYEKERVDDTKKPPSSLPNSQAVTKSSTLEK